MLHCPVRISKNMYIDMQRLNWSGQKKVIFGIANMTMIINLILFWAVSMKPDAWVNLKLISKLKKQNI